MMWYCNSCHKKADEISIFWGVSDGQKVDILDYFCILCMSADVVFHGTDEERHTWWDKEWKK